jgi:endonuclease/exonuclease/phosphatase family metal-dependent hydrolase
VDTRLGTRTGLLDLEALQRELGMVPVPLGNDGPAHGWHGNLILVRGALVEAVHKVALPGLEPRGAILADLAIRGAVLRVVAAHLGLLPSSRTAQARVLLDRIGALDDRPALLMGDLNEWRSGAAAFRTLERRFTTNGTAPSFPARRPMLPLDRIMACDRGALTAIEAHDSPLARRASDHLPVKARLRLPGAAGQGSF